ncbi:DUF2510 domain-containing protein [Tessaracoccus defluvii]|uniref:DUF2510 domain-containing protein n=1 Tax=Tessaracoccus defluvii TaxID=1285901 RepID=A0A7H0H6Z7_9ACTN|nr:DUF2510 domain-containing protein [Tessaracoccus defluvii]
MATAGWYPDPERPGAVRRWSATRWSCSSSTSGWRTG